MRLALMKMLCRGHRRGRRRVQAAAEGTPVVLIVEGGNGSGNDAAVKIAAAIGAAVSGILLCGLAALAFVCRHRWLSRNEPDPLSKGGSGYYGSSFRHFEVCPGLSVRIRHARCWSPVFLRRRPVAAGGQWRLSAAHGGRAAAGRQAVGHVRHDGRSRRVVLHARQRAAALLGAVGDRERLCARSLHVCPLALCPRCPGHQPLQVPPLSAPAVLPPRLPWRSGDDSA